MCIRDSCTVLRRDMDRGAGHRFTALYAALAGLPAARASGAVSYTHLDVYKRQGIFLAEHLR